MPTIVIALGGNALTCNNKSSAKDQKTVARRTADQLVSLVDAGYQLVLVHGNGPQVGNIILAEEMNDSESTPSMPLDTCVAMSQGQIGFWLQSEIKNSLLAHGKDVDVVTIVSQVAVNPEDSAFGSPAKPIGQFYTSASEAKQIADERGFAVKEDAGRGWRRVVPSPKPTNIIEINSIKTLVNHKNIVITGGGGGIPVVETAEGLVGIEAVIDKDHTGALLAEQIGADMFVILTAVPAVMLDYDRPDQRVISQATPSQLANYIDQGHFAPGSMLPKIEAACNFVKNTQKTAAIGGLEDISSIINGKKGTIIHP